MRSHYLPLLLDDEPGKICHLIMFLRNGSKGKSTDIDTVSRKPRK